MESIIFPSEESILSLQVKMAPPHDGIVSDGFNELTSSAVKRYQAVLKVILCRKKEALTTNLPLNPVKL